MPLKVSSQGWVKVAAPRRPPKKKYVDPEEEKEAMCSPLRYFACQAIDPTRERLRMLGDRVVYDADQDDVLRPGSRLERKSTLDEWRYDVVPSRSSSRMSGNMHEGSHPSSPPKNLNMNNVNTNHSQNVDVRKEHQGGRRTGKPMIISRSPPPSIHDDGELSRDNDIEVDECSDTVSVANTETPSERHCKHKHRHHKPIKAPSTIAEEEEFESAFRLPKNPTPTRVPTVAASEIISLRQINEEPPSPAAVPPPPPSVVRSEIHRSHKTKIEIPSTIPELASVASSPLKRTEKNSERHKNSHHLDDPEKFEGSSRSSGSSCSSGSSKSYRSRKAESESSYTESERSASPVRKHRHKRSEYESDEESYYPSPPRSPAPTIRRSKFESESHDDPLRSYRDRSVTAPIPRTRPPGGQSDSSWNSSSLSSRSKSSAPSIDGYQFQAAIFQPKTNYKGYRAPSLSKGNRWETATSALSFD